MLAPTTVSNWYPDTLGVQATTPGSTTLCAALIRGGGTSKLTLLHIPTWLTLGKYRRVYLPPGWRRAHWALICTKIGSKPGVCPVSGRVKPGTRAPLWKVYRVLAGVLSVTWYRGDAPWASLLRAVPAEVKTYFRRCTAVAQSLEVLTCSWAACQQKHVPACIVSQQPGMLALQCVVRTKEDEHWWTPK